MANWHVCGVSDGHKGDIITWSIIYFLLSTFMIVTIISMMIESFFSFDTLAALFIILLLILLTKSIRREQLEKFIRKQGSDTLYSMSKSKKLSDRYIIYLTRKLLNDKFKLASSQSLSDLKTLSNAPLETFIEYQLLSPYLKEVINYYYPLYKLKVERQENLLKKLPSNPLALEQLRNVQLELIKLKQGDTKLLSELTESYEIMKQYQIKYWTDIMTEQIETAKKEKINPEEHKPESWTIENWVSQCDKNIERYTEYLARLNMNDYNLCKELQRERDQREA